MSSSLWQDVVTAALVGTERQPLTLTPPDNQLGELLRRLNNTDAEGTLLNVAGAIALYQRAGRLAVTDNQPLPTSCELDDKPCCSPRAGQHLDLMLKGQHAEILPEWLTAVAEVGKRVPERYLVDLLELGRKQTQLRSAMLSVLGKRGQWLAAQNPDWNYVASEDVEETWQTGSRAARQLLLQRLRTENPSAARERLTATWNSEESEDKVAFLKTFHTGLSMEDEPFLEAALDERRKEVRQVAADLLAQLPKSKFCQRMIERSRFLITLKQEGELHLEVTLPESCDKEMSRDGIQSKSISKLGEKASLLLQILSCVPPSLWCQTWERTPEQLVKAINSSDWEKLLLEAWAIATIRNQDITWAETLLSWFSKHNNADYFSYLDSMGNSKDRLINVLPRDRAEALILNRLQSNPEPLHSQHPAFLVRELRHPWSAELSHAVLDSLRRHIDNNKENDWSLRAALKNFARYMMPSLVQQAASLSVLKQKSYWVEAVDEFLAILQFRYEMLQALQGEL